jgi:lysophospholipid acyltransferase
MDYIFYIYFFPSSLVGPVVSYSEYYHFIHADQNYFVKFDIKKLLIEIFSVIIGIAGSTIGYSIIDFSIVKTITFKNYSFLKQIYHPFLYCFFGRLRYLGVWSINHVSNLCSGIRRVDNEILKDPLTNIDIFKIESSLYIRDRINGWNMASARWLRECVYNKFMSILRVDKTKASLCTFISSAFWHGFYPAYYFCFFNWYVILEIQKSIFKLSKKIKINQILLNLALLFTSRLWIFPGIVFFHIDLSETLTLIYFMKEWFFVIFGLWIGLNIFGKKIRNREITNKEK